MESSRPRIKPKRKARGPQLRYRLKAPDGSIRIAIDDEFFEVWKEIDEKFGKDTAKLILPVEMVSAGE